MRAKRSKKYRKLMHQYELIFGFREPYQVLVDSNFLRAVHQFKMDLIPALERTLQGKVKPLLSKCSLAAIMAEQPINPKTNNPYRPYHLPPPTVLPLRHCSHNDQDEPIDEVECLLSLLCPNTDNMRNKEHYTLATAEPIPLPDQQPRGQHDKANEDNARKGKRAEEIRQRERERRANVLRSGARSVPGVPIIYVKRSVMILEPLSTPSERVRLGVERSKFKTGVEAAISAVSGGGTKRKREDGDEDDAAGAAPKERGLKKAKAPNPLSMKKPKKREKQKPEAQGKKGDVTAASNIDQGDHPEVNLDGAVGDESEKTKTKRKRRHKSAKAGAEDIRETGPVAAVSADE